MYTLKSIKNYTKIPQYGPQHKKYLHFNILVKTVTKFLLYGMFSNFFCHNLLHYALNNQTNELFSNFMLLKYG